MLDGHVAVSNHVPAHPRGVTWFGMDPRDHMPRWGSGKDKKDKTDKKHKKTQNHFA